MKKNRSAPMGAGITAAGLAKHAGCQTPFEEKTPAQQNRNAWERAIYREIESALDCPTSDAQGVFEAQPFIVAQCWVGGCDAATSAKAILAAGKGKEAKPELTLLMLARHYLAALNSSDSEHPDFLDSGADTVQLLWEYSPAKVKALIDQAEGKA